MHHISWGIFPIILLEGMLTRELVDDVKSTSTIDRPSIFFIIYRMRMVFHPKSKLWMWNLLVTWATVVVPCGNWYGWVSYSINYFILFIY
jgi:hypothetical protein